MNDVSLGLILNKIKENKLLISLAKGMLVVLSILVTHYAGFLSHFPIALVSAAAVEMFPTFSALTLFYVTFCYSFARVAGFVVSQGGVAFSIFIGAAYHRKGWRQRLRQYVRLYKNRPAEESIWNVGITIIFFFCLLFLVYVTPESLNLGPVFYVCSVMILMAVLLKSDLMVLKPKSLVKRVKNKRRKKYRESLFASYLFLGFGVVLSGAFVSGFLRYDRLMGEQPIVYKSANLKAELKVFISSSDSVVGLQEDEDYITWIYASKDAVMRFPYRRKSSISDETQKEESN
nr:hypothetical protein [Pseudomonas toyotomiensis]